MAGISDMQFMKYRQSGEETILSMWHVVNQELIHRVERSQYTRSRCKDA